MQKFPLRVGLCEDCGHVQLMDVVDPALLFSDYSYASGSNPALVRYFRDVADTVWRGAGMQPGDGFLEIGCNDGTLLSRMVELGAAAIGVDPAENLGADARSRGLPVVTDFFGSAWARNFSADTGQVKLVVANNVLAHIADIADVFSGVSSVLAEDGWLVFEVSYLLRVVQRCLFDTIYHEHLDYHSVTALLPFLRRFGFSMVRVEEIDMHGGSIRVWARAGRHDGEDSVARLLEEERAYGLAQPQRYQELKAKISEAGQSLRRVIEAYSQRGIVPFAYGVPAKATTLLHEFGLSGDHLGFAIDDSPWKQGRFLPGNGIEIKGPEAMADEAGGCMVILAWNFADRIMDRYGAFKDQGGTFVVPLPEFRVV